MLQPRPEWLVYISRWRQDLAPFMLVLQESRTQESWRSEMLVQWFQKKPVRAVCNTVVRFLEERVWKTLKLWRWNLSFKTDPATLRWQERRMSAEGAVTDGSQPSEAQMMPLCVFQILNTEMQPLLALCGFIFALDQFFLAVLPDLLFRMGIFFCLFVCCNNCFIETHSWKFSFASQRTFKWCWLLRLWELLR